MRTRLLCGLVLLCGAEVAHAQQQMPAYGYYGYYQQNAPRYQAAPVSYGYYGYSQNPQVSGYGQYYRGNGYYPSYANYNNYPAANYQYPAANYQNYYGYNYPQYMGAMQPPASGAASADAAAVADAVSCEPDVSEQSRSPSILSLPDHGGKDRCWVGAEYTVSWFRPQHLSGPLVTTGAVTDALPGALGQQGTAVLFGNNIDYSMFNGVKAELGFFLDCDNRFSAEVAGLYLFFNHAHFGASSDPLGNPVIARPVFNAVSGVEQAYLDALPANPIAGLPALAAGSVTMDSTAELWGGEVNGRCYFCLGNGLYADGLFGARYLRLAESLTIGDRVQPLVDNVRSFQGVLIPAVDSLADQDRFRTRNEFYGLQLGGRIGWEQEWFFVSAYAKVGLGATDENVNINGSTTLITPTGSQVAAGGILALPSNIGSHDRTVFGIVPEVGVNVGINVTKHLQLTAGYSFLYWNQVARPSGQIDRGVNPSAVPSDSSFGSGTGPTRPAFGFNDEYLWIHTLSVGVGIHY
jgi:hypothetical protein